MSDLLMRVKTQKVTADLILGVMIMGTTRAGSGGAIGGFVPACRLPAGRQGRQGHQPRAVHEPLTASLEDRSKKRKVSTNL